MALSSGYEESSRSLGLQAPLHTTIPLPCSGGRQAHPKVNLILHIECSSCCPINSVKALKGKHRHTHNCSTALFPGPPKSAGARRELLDFMVQGKINRGSHTDHPAGRHSIRTNQCPPPPSPMFLHAGCPSCRPANSVKALKGTADKNHSP